MRKFQFFSGFRGPTLVASWSPEMSNDLLLYHNVDAEAELTRLLSEEIARSIDNEIMQNLIRDINGERRA